mmetsp:Transcript_3136/g.9168  ORF Transcript_3136/g.9168 Transcript_3136/m.9168 type:complete len:613 (+) Transcript_3136:650-2488(+)
MARELTKYARSDTYAAELNFRFGWGTPTRILCPGHAALAAQRQADEMRSNAEATALREQLRRARVRVDEAERTTARARAEVDDARHELLEQVLEWRHACDACARAEVERDALRAARVECMVCAARTARTATDAELQCPDGSTEDTIYFGVIDADDTLSEAALSEAGGFAMPVGRSVGCQAPDPEGGALRRETTHRGSLLRRAPTTYLERRPSVVESAVAEVAAAAEALPDESLSSGPSQKRACGGGDRWKRKAPAGSGGVSLDALLETIHDVYEKQALADDKCHGDGVAPTTLDVILRKYFREKLGLKKLAREKTRATLRCTAERADTSTRVRLFAVAVGLEQFELGEDDGPGCAGAVAHYSPHFAHTLVHLLGALHADKGRVHIAESFRSQPEGTYLVPRAQMLYALIGSRGAMDAECLRDEPSTWRNHVLAQHLSPAEVGELLADVDALPEKRISARRGIDVDDVLWLLLRHHARATVRHERWLRAAFERFDTDAPGLQEIEFVHLVRWAMGPAADRMAPLELHTLFANIEELADQGGNDDNSDDIDDPEAFPKAVIQLDCALARPANCRNYHLMNDDDAWPTGEIYPSKLTRAQLGALRHAKSKGRAKP